MEEGLLVVEREEVTDGRLRRYYRLTDEGATALRLEVESMRSKAQMAAARLRRAGAPGVAFHGAG